MCLFPGEEIDLRNQSGDFADVANKYALAGATASATTGSDGLTVTMKAKAAVLRIVGVNKDDILDINVKTADGNYVLGLTADKNSAGFRVDKSDTKVSLLSKQGAGVYYVVVPAEVKLSVYNGTKHMRTTKEAGLTAGKYYTLYTGDREGDEYATINGVEIKKHWVQLWPGGPKFATENVASKMTWKGATKTDAEYVWGANWRTPTKDEMTFVSEHTLTPINTKAEIQVQNGVIGILFTGIKPGYTDKTLFLSGENVGGYYHACYWTSTVIKQGYGTFLDITFDEEIFGQYFFNTGGFTTEGTKYQVRPVLAK